MTVLWRFLILTLRQPGVAARSILLKQWPAEAVWTGLLLAIVLNTLFFGILSALMPQSQELGILIMPDGPSGLTIITAALRSVGFAAVLTIGGRWLGGTGRFMPIMTLLVWHQLVQLVVLSAIIVAMLIMPLVGSLLFLIVGIALFFVLLHFVNEAHGFASLWRSFAVVLMATILLFFAMIFLVGLLGLDNLGLPENV